MAVLRNAPGERVEVAGLYRLVHHWGEDTKIAPRWLDKGEMFPLLGVSSEAGPLWYVRLYEAIETTQAA
jgi:hypothetical protein